MKPLHKLKISELETEESFCYLSFRESTLKNWAVAIVKQKMKESDLKLCDLIRKNLDNSSNEIFTVGNKHQLICEEEDRIVDSGICDFLIDRFEITKEDLK